ncbi:hypothetical protein E1B28_013144 [Marasmius oreades]|uniref:HMG box domain-containing protein n=1 Tax=Marasmius oreades TaxID=181124 RepID=A0A9P7RNZ9_9AGAR|nr:uncharacterized protein E1B28_013144 [Marasmius oreades]KAG7087164.1 hypothetical protein E1B28_013144 [Marasmius oreades]
MNASQPTAQLAQNDIGTTASVPSQKPLRSRKRVDDHIPRPPNAFVLFRKDIAPELHRLHQKEISKIASQRWDVAKTDGSAAKYYLLAEKEKQRHALRYPDYKYQPERRSKDAKGRKKVTEVAQPSQRLPEATSPAQPIPSSSFGTIPGSSGYPLPFPSSISPLPVLWTATGGVPPRASPGTYAIAYPGPIYFAEALDATHFAGLTYARPYLQSSPATTPSPSASSGSGTSGTHPLFNPIPTTSSSPPHSDDVDVSLPSVGPSDETPLPQDAVCGAPKEVKEYEETCTGYDAVLDGQVLNAMFDGDDYPKEAEVEAQFQPSANSPEPLDAPRGDDEERTSDEEDEPKPQSSFDVDTSLSGPVSKVLTDCAETEVPMPHASLEVNTAVEDGANLPELPVSEAPRVFGQNFDSAFKPMLEIKCEVFETKDQSSPTFKLGQDDNWEWAKSRSFEQDSEGYISDTSHLSDLDSDCSDDDIQPGLSIAERIVEVLTFPLNFEREYYVYAISEMNDITNALITGYSETYFSNIIGGVEDYDSSFQARFDELLDSCGSYGVQRAEPLFHPLLLPPA